ncbi:MAG: hypothetical protein ACTHLN_08800 [Tepidisphaeraceae bacterium]
MATHTENDVRTTGTTKPVVREIKNNEAAERDNPDAITGAPGSHPVGTGVGAAAAGAAGAAIGSVIPGVGTAIGGTVGAVVGAVAGGLAGKGVAEKINPTDEAAYWRENHRNRDYYDSNFDYETDYGPAYTSAVETYNAYPGRSFDQSEADLRQSWEARRGSSKMDWERAKRAMRDVYERDRRTSADRSDAIDRV